MKIELNSLVQSSQSGLVKVGEIAKAKRAELAYNRAMASILGHTDQDYTVLSYKLNSQEHVHLPQRKTEKTFAEGLKNFLEKGCMF